MNQLIVDLDAYIVPDDHRVFKCFPGKGYRFYDAIREASAIFLDVRGLEQLGDDATLWAKKDIVDVVRADRQAREAAMVAAGRRPPTRTGYSRTGYSRTDRRDQNFILGLFQLAKKGDLVVVPAEGYQRDVLIGEFVDEPGPVAPVTLQDSHNRPVTYLGRRVRWLGKQKKRLFSDDLIQLLHSQTAFFDIGQRHYEAIYEIAYHNYASPQNFVASFTTSKQTFTARDNLLVSLWFEAISAVRNVVDGEAGPFQPDQRLFEIAVSSSFSEASELSININSPGEFILRSSREFALVVMALFTLASAQPTFAQAQSVHVEAKHVGNASSECVGRVDASVRRYLDALGAKKWQEACDMAVAASKSATLATDAKLKAREEDVK